MIEGAEFSRRRLLGAGCVAACSPLLPSCARSTTIARKTALRDLDIVMTQGVTGLEMHEVARAQGYFDEFGINPKVVLVSDGGKCVAALLSGAAKIAIGTGFNQLTPAIEKGAQIRILAGALNLPSLCVYSANSAVETVRDLGG